VLPRTVGSCIEAKVVETSLDTGRRYRFGQDYGRGGSGVVGFWALIRDKKPKSNGIEKRKARVILIMRPAESATGWGQKQGAAQGGYTKRVDVAKGLVVEP
jgi:hypothetical protein